MNTYLCVKLCEIYDLYVLVNSNTQIFCVQMSALKWMHMQIIKWLTVRWRYGALTSCFFFKSATFENTHYAYVVFDILINDF